MTVVLFVAVLLLLIVGHEFGHFITAKWLKMKVLEFGIGFPPKLFGKKFKEGGTEYTVNWLPFGGFVRIFGEDEKEATDPIAFPNRPTIHQAAVLFAGPFANIILAVVLSMLAFMVGTFAVIDSPETAARAENAQVLIGAVLPDSPAAEAGIEAGTRIVSADTPEMFAELVASSNGPVDIVVAKNGEEKTLTITPVTGLVAEEPERKAIGVSTALVGEVSYPLHEALWLALIDTARDFVYILVSLIALIGSALTFSADVSQIAGPVGIATLTGDAAALGLGALFSFAALLSTNLAIINLLPFPALDGGRLLFLGIEAITRKKIPLRTAQVVNSVGFAILILLMVAVTVGDISRLVG